MKVSLEGKVALITGTGGGQGRAAALAFVEAGALVVGCDLKVEGNEETAALVRSRGGSMVAMQPVDLGDRAQARQWVAEATAQHGRIDVVYNNASAARLGPFEQVSDADWDYTIRNELDLCYSVTRAAWPYLMKRGGVIINIASIAATNAAGAPQAAHSATKGAIVALTRELAMEGGAHGIRVLCISPGVIETPPLMEYLSVPEIREAILARNLIKRIGRPEDIAAAAVFLASDLAGYITGINLVIDGGYTAS